MALLIAVLLTVFIAISKSTRQTEQPAEMPAQLYTWFTDDNLPEGADVEQTGTQYRFRRMEYRKGEEEPVLEGWEMYNRNTVWSEEIETTSDSVIMQSDPETIQYRAEVKYNEIESVQYNYKRYHYVSDGVDYYTYTGKSGNGEWEYKSLLYELPRGSAVDNRQTRMDENGGIWFKAGVNKEGEITENETVTVASLPYTVYYFRLASYTYDFRRFGEFSGWSFTPVEQTDEVEVEQRTVYKVKK